jgi:hypothetical protein
LNDEREFLGQPSIFADLVQHDLAARAGIVLDIDAQQLGGQRAAAPAALSGRLLALRRRAGFYFRGRGGFSLLDFFERSIWSSGSVSA